jgi:hypothetical protein
MSPGYKQQNNTKGSWRPEVINWRALSVALLAALTWVVVAFFSVPPIIEDAYVGRSHPALNALIRGRGELPLDHYNNLWWSYAVRFGIALFFASYGIVFALPRLIECVRSSRVGGMKPHRVLVSYAVIGIVAGGQLLCIVLAIELWPFSHYPMYSTIERTDTVSLFEVYGVDANGREHHMMRPNFFRPFDPSRLSVALKKKAAEGRLEDAAAALFEHWSRFGKEFTEFDLLAVRVYRCEWLVSASVDNVHQPARELLAEYRNVP